MTYEEAKKKLNELYIRVNYPEYREAINVATKCINKEIPEQIEKKYNDTGDSCCPACNKIISWFSNYCPNCGQSLE